MRQAMCLMGMWVAVVAAPGLAGTFPRRGLGPPSEPHPATVAMRDCTATIQTNLGAITLKFEPDAAPNAARMFIKLAESGAYDGARFYCVFKDRMIIGGIPPTGAKQTGGEPLTHEETPQSVVAGAVLLDRAPDGKNCPGRFLIILADQPHLDGDYTLFAEVTQGLDVAKRIGSAAARSTDGSPAPVEDVAIEQVTVSRKPKPASKEANRK